jgi:hypothetical protein
MMAWAIRELGRHPKEAILSGIALSALVCVVATVLLLVEAWTQTVTDLLELGPSLVVRRVDALGWKPIPVRTALASTKNVVGVVSAVPRVWGVVTGPKGPLTVLGVNSEAMASLQAKGIASPTNGQAVVGPGVLADSRKTHVTLTGQASVTFEIVSTLKKRVALTLYDVVLLTTDDARNLLGFGSDEASDLAVGVFHEAEEEAVIPDLAKAYPWPARITTKAEAIGSSVAAMSLKGGFVMMLLVPAILSLVLLTVARARSRTASQRERGIYKALGWTTRDLITLEIFESLAVGVPGFLIGFAVAWALVFWPGVSWPGVLLLGWQTSPPPLTLTLGGCSLVLLTMAAVVLLPWFLASIVSAIGSSIKDPSDLIRGGG